MDVDEARPLASRLLAEYADLVIQAEEASEKASGIFKLLNAYFEVFPELHKELVRPDSLPNLPRAESDQPRGAEAVRLIMQERPDYQWYVSELVTALRERDWLPESDNPANAVRTALERLITSEGSDIKKLHLMNNKVAYVYAPDDDPDPPVTFSKEPF